MSRILVALLSLVALFIGAGSTAAVATEGPTDQPGAVTTSAAPDAESGDEDSDEAPSIDYAAAIPFFGWGALVLVTGENLEPLESIVVGGFQLPVAYNDDLGVLAFAEGMPPKGTYDVVVTTENGEATSSLDYAY